MNITNKSDNEIYDIVTPMINDVIEGSNQKNWALFSKYQTQEELNNPDNRKNVETQWEQHELLTSLTSNREFLGVLRRDDMVQVIWKQKSIKEAGDFLACYAIQEIDNEIKEIGFRIL